MRKTCKCGNVLSDTIVPNNVIYWTNPASEEDDIIKSFNGEYPKLTQIAIWHCCKCERFYYWSDDWKLYTFRLKDINCSDFGDIDWQISENKYYSYNDFEEDEMLECLERTGELNFYRDVKVIEENKIIAIKSSDKIKVYEVEDVDCICEK